MVGVFDVAEYVLSEVGYVSTMKLQKLVFYSQAYSLVAFDEPLFSDDFEAWVNGPVCPPLFRAHKGLFVVGKGDLRAEGDLGKVTKEQASCVKHVVLALGKLSGQELSALTHAESPWLDARNGCSDDERCTAVIAKQAIKEYYSSSACSNVVFANLTS